MAVQSIDLSALHAAADRYASVFESALPFRHVVLDDFLREEVAHRAARVFPAFESMQQRYAGLVEARAKERRFELLDPVFARIFAELQAPEFIAFVERVTGVSGLQSDATFSGAGLHQVRDGGYHNVHADANIHPATGNFQRVNMLLYLNERWEPAWGGELELWDASMSRCETRIAPAFNRCLLIEVHDRAYHGYPRLHLPSGITRKSLTCWYYSKEPHALQSRVSHPVAFQVRPTDTLGARAKHHLRRALSAVRSRLPHR